MQTPEKGRSFFDRVANVVVNTIPFASRLLPVTPAATPGTAAKSRNRSSGKVRFMDPPVQSERIVDRYDHKLQTVTPPDDAAVDGAAASLDVRQPSFEDSPTREGRGRYDSRGGATACSAVFFHPPVCGRTTSCTFAVPPAIAAVDSLSSVHD